MLMVKASQNASTSLIRIDLSLFKPWEPSAARSSDLPRAAEPWSGHGPSASELGPGEEQRKEHPSVPGRKARARRLWAGRLLLDHPSALEKHLSSLWMDS